MRSSSSFGTVHASVQISSSVALKEIISLLEAFGRPPLLVGVLLGLVVIFAEQAEVSGVAWGRSWHGPVSTIEVDFSLGAAAGSCGVIAGGVLRFRA